jgi:AcrR family transcriptional regulator
VTEGGTLRDQQAEFTRQIVMEAAKRVLDTYSIDEFSIQKIAEEAGMSHRTVYRYFPTRQALLDSFTDWIEDTVAPIPVEANPQPETREEILASVRIAFDRFDRFAPYFRASLMLASRGETIQPQRQRQRDEFIRKALTRVLEPLDDEQAAKAYAIIRILVGAQSWQALHDRFELTDGKAGDAAIWAVEVLLDALENGHYPGSSGGSPEKAGE